MAAGPPVPTRSTGGRQGTAMNQYGRAALGLLAIPVSADAQVGTVAVHGEFAGAHRHRRVRGPACGGFTGVIVCPTVGGALFAGQPLVPLYGGSVYPWAGDPPLPFWGGYPVFGYAGVGPAIMPPVV